MWSGLKWPGRVDCRSVVKTVKIITCGFHKTRGIFWALERKPLLINTLLVSNYAPLEVYSLSYIRCVTTEVLRPSYLQ
jgi:hypothetical protein